MHLNTLNKPSIPCRGLKSSQGILNNYYMQKKIMFGIGLGIIAGLIDLIPMIIQDLSWNANLSAFSMWIIIGFLVSVTEINTNEVLKSMLIAILVLLPNLFIIGVKDPLSIIPIVIMTLILSSMIGLFYKKIKDGIESNK
ncbi:MAG: hypothetical protein A2W99_14580 [Bacteroidetes bacterium GWF2_33_16]|nr:MAG: hypothetical protein A2X00_08790 [Bacteroidetes bacterium GWE2_32_14]OFY04898.1 MAG: hypothetical protein A2W99_14580 [Bacteroidetes bacterium GWF2_33_16]